MSRAPITAVVTTLDNAATLDACLASLAFCDEIVLLDRREPDALQHLDHRVEPDRVVEYALWFPDYNLRSAGAITLEPAGAATKVTWSNAGDLGGNRPCQPWHLGRDPDLDLAVREYGAAPAGNALRVGILVSAPALTWAQALPATGRYEATLCVSSAALAPSSPTPMLTTR